MLSSPSDVLQLVQRFFEKEDATLITKAFSVGNCHWIQRVDMARFVMLYAMGGLYLDLDVQVNEPLDELLAASLILTRGNSENHIELDIVGANAGDLRVLDLVKKQAHNVLKKKGHGMYPDSAISLVTGVRVVTAWSKEHGLAAKPLANRFIEAKGAGSCKADLKIHQSASWAATLVVKKPFFTVHHASSWCRAGRGLKKSFFKATIRDTSSLGKLKAWNAPKNKSIR